MDSLFKITFGVLLGIVGCLAWDFYQAQQAARRGFRPGWVSLDVDGVVARRPTTPTTTATKKPAGGNNLTQATPVKNPPPQTTPTPAPKTAPSPTPKAVTKSQADEARAAFARLAQERHRWPKSVKLNDKYDVPLMSDGKIVGKIPIEAGKEIEVLQVLADGRLASRIGKIMFHIPGSRTNALERALPVGTPPPPRPVVVTPPRPPVPQPPGNGVTPQPRQGEADSKQTKNGKKTLFGTRYE